MLARHTILRCNAHYVAHRVDDRVYVASAGDYSQTQCDCSTVLTAD